MEILQQFVFDESEHKVTIVDDDNGDPLFKASDIGVILGIKNMDQEIFGFSEYQRQIISNDTNSTKNDGLFLTEKGVYHVLLKSQNPIARAFQDWTMKNVMAEIIKNGSYEVENLKEELESCKKKIKISQDHNALQDMNENIKQNGEGLKQNKIQQMDVRIDDMSNRLENRPVTTETNIIQNFVNVPRRHTQTRGSKIQRYSTDGKELLETYTSAIIVTRDKKLPTLSVPALNVAINKKSVYKGFRWASLERKLSDETVQEIGKTAVGKTVNIGHVAMINLAKTKIVEVFPDQKAASNNRGFANGSAVSRAVRKGTKSGGHYFKMWHCCSDELKQQYLSKNNLPERERKGGKGVIRIDVNGNENVYQTVTAVTRDMSISVASIHSAANHGHIAQGFRWKWK